MIVDAHVHVGPWRLAGLEVLAPSLEDAVAAAVAEAVQGMAVTRSDGGDDEALRRAVGEERRIALWYMPWVRPGTEEPDRALAAEGPRVAALKVHPSVDRTPIAEPGYDRAFAAAEEAGVPVVVHTGRWQEVAGFEMALQRAAARPDLRVVLAHAGGNDFGLRLRCADRIEELGLDNVWLDLTGIGMPLLTRTLVERLGAARFLFGSDYPLGHPRVQIAHVTAMGLERRATEAILGGNAERLLGPPSNAPRRGAP